MLLQGQFRLGECLREHLQRVVGVYEWLKLSEPPAHDLQVQL